MRHQARLRQGSQIDKPYAVGKTIEHLRGQLQRKARLAAPAGTRKREQAGGYRESQEFSDFAIAPDEVRQLCRKIVLEPPGSTHIEADEQRESRYPHDSPTAGTSQKA